MIEKKWCILKSLVSDRIIITYAIKSRYIEDAQQKPIDVVEENGTMRMHKAFKLLVPEADL